MKELICDKCGNPVKHDTVFCPNCGAAVFRTAHVTPSAPPLPKSAPVETPPEGTSKKFSCKKLIPPAAVILAVLLALTLSWDTLSGLFQPTNDPQLSSHPSTQQPLPSTELTAPPTQATIPPTTSPLIVPTETAPTEPDLSWVVENPQYLGYEDFFSIERAADVTLRPLVWTDTHGVDCVLASHEGLQIFRGDKYVFRIPNSQELADHYTLICADGQYAYLHDSTQFLQLDLLTGETKPLFTFDEIIHLTHPFREMCYIAAEMNGTISLCRLYLPTATLDVLYDDIPARTPREWLTITFPSGNRGTIFWQGISPEMVDALYAEFSNPNSIYFPNFSGSSSDLSEYWNDPELIRKMYRDGYSGEPMIKLQDDKGLQALWKGSYKISDGTVTQDWGVVDTCWFGSGYPHDHWNPELTEDIPPTILNAEDVPVPGITPPSAEMAASIRRETYDDENKLYTTENPYVSDSPVLIYLDGKYQIATNLPYVKKGNRLQNCKYYSYYISVDDTLIRLDLSGNARVLYTAKNGGLSELCYNGGTLYFLDGNTIVTLDTVACTSRELLTHPGSIGMYYDTYYQKLYIDTVLGLQINSYLFDPVTGTLEETTYQL